MKRNDSEYWEELLISVLVAVNIIVVALACVLVTVAILKVAT